jgi:hypothetical protein
MFVVNRIAIGDLRVARTRDVSLPWRTFLTSTGVVKMTQFALATRAQLRNVVLCTLATLTLAACGGEDGSSSAATASTSSDAAASQVSSSVGMIDRSQGIDTTATTAVVANTGGASSAAAVASNTPSGVTTTAPASGTTSGTTTTANTTTTPASGTSTTVASSSKSTTPVKTTTTNGVATLDWMPPTENSDGSVLTNLAGYTVYYGTSPDSLTQSIKVTNPGLTAYSVTNLSSGTWYFAVTSYSSTGVESTRTGTLSTTI